MIQISKELYDELGEMGSQRIGVFCDYGAIIDGTEFVLASGEDIDGYWILGKECFDFDYEGVIVKIKPSIKEQISA